jgi:hypothetical protein
MKSKFRPLAVAVYSVIGTVIVLVIAQKMDLPSRLEERRQSENRGGFGQRGRRMQQASFRNARNSGPTAGQDFAVRKRFDKNEDKILSADERAAALEYIEKEITEGRGPRRGPMSGRRTEGLGQAGRKISPADVRPAGDAPLYAPDVVRTIFLEFDNDNWEKELDAFYHTDAEVPTRVIVDGETYPDVGVHFHGASSYFTLREFGQKASLVLSMDMAHEKQDLLGYRTLDLLNSHSDPSFLRSVLYLHVANQYLPAPKANFARVVINNENWGIYVNVEHFNKDFVQARFPKSKGARWKTPGSPRGRAGLNYLGEDIGAYKDIYEIKSKDDPASWQQLIRLCRVLTETELPKLEAELDKVLDVDGALKFLALENALINSDGYWIRSSDYNLCQDENGRFHILPHDTNETFAPPGRPGGGRRGDGEEPSVTLDPLEGANDPSKPLLSRVLAVKNLRSRYLGYVKQIATESMDWKQLGPVAAKYHALIADEVATDTKKLYSTARFEQSLDDGGTSDPSRMSIKEFVEKRRAFLLSHPEVKNAALPAQKR